jgi:hypothetical protein
MNPLTAMASKGAAMTGMHNKNNATFEGSLKCV